MGVSKSQMNSVDALGIPRTMVNLARNQNSGGCSTFKLLQNSGTHEYQRISPECW